ncbi:MAG: HlyD family secretion protein [Reyranella sp.]|uniref:HlyD family secretion protein n=1 Tax=Reyranella sp. TaxID=1929291 RepID=UPI0025E1A2A0|nr:biotin/lipoyl-binding protein [Reyranella sp.]MBR2815904.1 HlyD family secretion protein [Reyranella sp.]
MIIVLLNVYLVLLFLLVKLGLIRLNLFWKVSPVLVLLLLLIGLFIPMNWGAPQGAALVVRNSVAIVPSVAGEVIDVPVEANRPIKEGDVLFRIDPVPFEASVKTLKAQLTFAKLRLEQMSQLQSSGAGRAFDVEQREAEVGQLRGQLEAAQWNLDKTTVRAPAEGYVTNVALRKGARVASLPLAPVMAFIDTSETIIGVSVDQIAVRYVEPGQPVELTFKAHPGIVRTGKVETVLQAIAMGQVQTSGQAVAPGLVQAAPFVVRVKLDDEAFAQALPAGAVGEAAIFTNHVRPSHLIRRVILRQIAILNYVNPF